MVMSVETADNIFLTNWIFVWKFWLVNTFKVEVESTYSSNEFDYSNWCSLINNNRVDQRERWWRINYETIVDVIVTQIFFSSQN